MTKYLIGGAAIVAVIYLWYQRQSNATSAASTASPEDISSTGPGAVNYNAPTSGVISSRVSPVANPIAVSSVAKIAPTRGLSTPVLFQGSRFQRLA